MSKNITFKYSQTMGNVWKELSRNNLFKPLTDYLHQLDLTLLAKEPIQQELTIAELKKKLNYQEEAEEILVPSAETAVLTDLVRDSEQITLHLPSLICLNKKNIQKMLRVDKYYNHSTYLFRKFTSTEILQKEEFFLPFLELPTLLAMLKSLPDTQKISIGTRTDLNELISVKAMRAINQKIKENTKVLPSSVTLIMSEECNLRCVYCYEPHQKRDKTVLSFEKAKQVLRKFDKDSKVIFFGGEPMLNIELMKQICEWGWEYRNFSFEMVTNGQIIDRAFFRDYAKYFTQIQLSCDGPEKAQDINRGHGSFKRTMEFFTAFREEAGYYPILHPVLSKYTVPYLMDMVQWFYALETGEGYEYTASLRWLPGDANSWTEEDFRLYAEQLCLLKKWYLENNIRETSFSVRAFAMAEHALLNIKNKEQNGTMRGDDAFCSAGRSLMAVLPSGNMIPCHHEHWAATNQERPTYAEISLDDDSLGVNHLSEMCIKDIPECNACPQWGCCVCPGSFYFQSGSHTKPDKNWCRAGKMLIEIAKSYVEELAIKLNDTEHRIDYLAAGVDYLLQKET